MPEVLSENTKASKTSDIDVNMFKEVLGASPCFACIRPKSELELGFCEDFEAQNYFRRRFAKKGPSGSDFRPEASRQSTISGPVLRAPVNI